MAHRVLVVDDEADLLFLFQKKLKLRQYECFVATNSADGWTIAQQEQPDLVILDLLLSGQHGFVLLRRLKNDPVLRKTKVIIMTAMTSAATRTEALRLGAEAYFEKPLDMGKLVETIERLLGGPQTSASSASDECGIAPPSDS